VLAAIERPKQARPWSKIDPKLRNAMLLGSTLPAVMAAAIWALTGYDFIVVLFGIFLPLQIVGGAFSGYVGYGKRGILDGLLVVVTLFLSAFVLVMLSSVIWAVFATGFEALSPHFFYQNNRTNNGPKLRRTWSRNRWNADDCRVYDCNYNPTWNFDCGLHHRNRGQEPRSN
jgi:hypothetical protein